MSRLSRDEFVNTVRDLFGDAIATTLTPDDDYVVHGSVAVGAREVAVSRAGVRSYAEAAATIAQRAVVDTTWRARLTSCLPKGAETACARPLVAELGRRLFRRPLAVDELDRWTKVATEGTAVVADFWGGLRAALAGMLLSPKFTHRIELGRVDGKRTTLTDHELASRLSYLLWDTTPDGELLAAADRGDLTTGAASGVPAGLATQVERMLADPKRLERGVGAFSADYFTLHRLDEVEKDRAKFPADSPELRASMRRASIELGREMVRRGAAFLDVLDANVAFVDRRLGAHYGLRPTTDALVRVDLPKTGGRLGLLTEPSLLATYAGPELTSPTLRGRFIREQLLCGRIPDPPADVDQSIPATARGRTRREQLTDHMTNPACGGCHRAIDPLGFGLEGFDAYGQIQPTDHGAPVVTAGELDGAPFDGARALSRLLKAHASTAGCFVRHVFRHVTGVDDEAVSTSASVPLLAVHKEQGGKLAPLLRALVLSDAFRFLNGTR
jgi:hypothetical protein